MGGGTGGIRTQNHQSGSNGSRTLGSILASSSGSGSIRRIYVWYRHNNNPSQFYNSVFCIKFGQFRRRTNLFLDNSY